MTQEIAPHRPVDDIPLDETVATSDQRVRRPWRLKTLVVAAITATVTAAWQVNNDFHDRTVDLPRHETPEGDYSFAYAQAERNGGLVPDVQLFPGPDSRSIIEIGAGDVRRSSLLSDSPSKGPRSFAAATMYDVPVADTEAPEHRVAMTLTVGGKTVVNPQRAVVRGHQLRAETGTLPCDDKSTQAVPFKVSSSVDGNDPKVVAWGTTTGCQINETKVSMKSLRAISRDLANTL